MIKVQSVYDLIDIVAPFSTSEEWDNAGVIIGCGCDEISKVLCTLDLTYDAINYAEEIGASLIVSHHPPIFKPLYNLKHTPCTEAVRKGISVISAHTNVDKSKKLCNDNKIVSALNLTVIDRLEDYGYVAECDSLYNSINEIAMVLKEKLGLPYVTVIGEKNNVKRVAICCGAGGDFIETACGLGATLFITGEMKHSEIILANQKNMPVLLLGHFGSEKVFADNMADYLVSKGIDAVPYYNKYDCKVI